MIYRVSGAELGKLTATTSFEIKETVMLVSRSSDWSALEEGS